MPSTTIIDHDIEHILLTTGCMYSEALQIQAAVRKVEGCIGSSYAAALDDILALLAPREPVPPPYTTQETVDAFTACSSTTPFDIAQIQSACDQFAAAITDLWDRFVESFLLLCKTMISSIANDVQVLDILHTFSMLSQNDAPLIFVRAACGRRLVRRPPHVHRRLPVHW